MTEDPRLTATRETMFRNDIERLDEKLREVLRWVVVSREVPIGWDARVLSEQTSFLVRDGKVYRLVEAYRPLLEKWVAETSPPEHD